MGFKENLKAELQYKGMLVKELAIATGIKRHTLDNYLNTHNSIPNAEVAVKIANALGVTVEYLVTGKDSYDLSGRVSISEDLRLLIETGSQLSRKNRKIALELMKTLKNQDNT